MAISTKNRLYSDPSYGSYKVKTFGPHAAGTRATALVDRFVAMNPITVLDCNAANSTLGTGGSSKWTLCATSANGTAALGTIIFVGTHAAGATVEGTDITQSASTTIPTGGALDVYSVLSSAAALTISFNVLYKDAYSVSDN